VRDGPDHELTFSDEFLTPLPTGVSELNGSINQFDISVKSTNPVRMVARYLGSYTETPILAARDDIWVLNTSSSTTPVFDISSLDFVPGNFLVALTWAYRQQDGGAFGSSPNLNDNLPADWQFLASDAASAGSTSARWR